MILYESVETLQKDYPLSSIYKALNINKSSYLYWLNFGKENKQKLIIFYTQIITIYSESKGIYGSPKITAILNKNGTICSVSKVSIAMKTLGIKSIVSKRFPKKTSKINEKEKGLIVNLIKDLTIFKINQVWTTDITYIKTINEGTFYLISFIDYYSKKVVAWNLFENQKTDKIINV